ncbi:hypothetical protein ACRAWF_08780 [Streptomyces sp. L7]
MLLLAFAMVAPGLGGPVGNGLIHGLKLVAVAVVAQAVWDMARKLCPDWQRASIALISIAVLSALTTVLRATDRDRDWRCVGTGVVPIVQPGGVVARSQGGAAHSACLTWPAS